MAKDRTRYIPTKREEKDRERLYKNVEAMIQLRNQKYKEFNNGDGDRTLKEYIDDSDRRLNGYTLTREAQGKEEWQENLFNPITRQKTKAILAGVALTPPELMYKALNREGKIAPARAEVVKQLVRYSRQLGNHRLENYLDGWDMLGKGTVITHEAYRYCEELEPIVTGYDPVTGKIKVEKQWVVTEDHAESERVNLMEFLIWDFYTRDIQKQPRIAWIQYYEYDGLKKEFQHFPNFKYLKSLKQVMRYENDMRSYFYERWSKRCEDNQSQFEVIRYYSKADKCYEVWINGVPMIQSPLLWGKRRKMYPFGKAVAEPFANSEFFYGKSFPSVIEGWQDIDNTTWNSILDKSYRSYATPMLVGLVNRDMLDLEDDLVDNDTKIYVPDIEQVKPMPVNGINAGDVQLINMIQRAEDLVSVDMSQQGVAGKGVTAREIILADERSQQLKGMFFMMLEDLALQKERLRVNTVLMHFFLPKTERIIGKNGVERTKEIWPTYNVQNTRFSDGTIGDLGMRIVKDKEHLPTPEQIEDEEAVMQQYGMNYKLIAIPTDYIDEWEVDFTIVPESLENKSMARAQALIVDKLQGIANFFPEHFVQNKDALFIEYAEAYGNTQDDYEMPEPKPAGPTLPDGSVLGLEEGEITQPDNGEPEPALA